MKRHTAVAEYSYITDRILKLTDNTTPWHEAAYETRPVRVGSAEGTSVLEPPDALQARRL